MQEALCGFITEVKKLDGTDFPPKTLYKILVCIQMSLETKGIHWRFLEDDMFCALKYILDNEMKIHTCAGMCCHQSKQQLSPNTKKMNCGQEAYLAKILHSNCYVL